MSIAIKWLQEQAAAQQDNARNTLANIDETQPDFQMAMFVIAMTTAHTMNALAHAFEIVDAENIQNETDKRREAIAERAHHARAAAAKGVDTGDWSDFDALIGSETDGVRGQDSAG